MDDEYKYAWLWTLLFGSFYFGYKGNWTWFWLGWLASIATFGISWIVIPFFSRKIMEKHDENKRATA